MSENKKCDKCGLNTKQTKYLLITKRHFSLSVIVCSDCERIATQTIMECQTKSDVIEFTKNWDYQNK